MTQKTSPLLRSEMLALLGKTVAADHMYSRHNSGKCQQHVKTPLSQKRKIFFSIFIAFL